MINQVETLYEQGVAANKERETLFTRSLQMWLRPLSDEVNLQNGKLVLIFNEDGSNQFRLEGVDDALQQKVAAQFPRFATNL
jgi:hypothetical protein